MSPNLKPQDILIALKLAAHHGETMAPVDLVEQLHLAKSEVSRSLQRLSRSHLYNAFEKRVRRKDLLRFLTHGLEYVFPAELGPTTAGIPTAFSAAPLNRQIVVGPGAGAVWPSSEGTAHGHRVTPLHKKVPMAAVHDPILYEYLALADALRVGRAREKNLAREELTLRLT